MSNVSVPVIVDSIAEKIEEFHLTLSVPSSLGPAITADNKMYTATGVIIDSTSEYIIMYVVTKF